MHLHSSLEMFQKLLPPKIKCANEGEYKFAHFRKKERALQFEMIIPNHCNTMGILTLDMDIPIDHYNISPQPNIITYNKGNPRSHLMYFLETPVHANPNSSSKARKYCQSVYNGLIASLGADPSYNQQFTKNPLHEAYRAFPMHDRPWSLEHLCEYVEPLNEKPKADVVGFGRNCDIFDTTRQWAYKAIRDYKSSTYDNFYAFVLNHCHGLNKPLYAPLSNPEIKDIAKSIAGWVWERRYQLTSFTKQEAGRRKSMDIRHLKSETNRHHAIEMLSKGFLIPDIADTLGVTRMTVYRWINDVSS